MAYNVTVGTLVSRTRVASDTENDGHVADADIKGWLAEAYGQLWDLYASSYFQRYRTTQTIPTTGAQDYALPAEYQYTLGVVYAQSTSCWRQLSEVPYLRHTDYVQAGIGEATAFAIVNGNVRLLPTPPSGQTYYHDYVPQPVDISSAADGTSIDVVSTTGSRYLVRAAAVDAKIKAEADPRDLKGERTAAWERLEIEASKQILTEGRPVVVRTIEEQDYLPGDFGRWGGP